MAKILLDSADAREAGEGWEFLRAFIRSPRTIGSVIQSSPFLKRRIVEAAELSEAKVVVELGTGTGRTSRWFLGAMATNARLIGIERTKAFVPALENVADPRFEPVHGCASHIRDELEQRGHAGADVVISGIPFSTLPPALCTTIASEIEAALNPGGRFVAYQLKGAVAQYMTPFMGVPAVEHEPLNIPPMRVFRWQKTAAR